MLFSPSFDPLQDSITIRVDIPHRLTLQLHNHTFIKGFSGLLCQDTKNLRVEVLL